MTVRYGLIGCGMMGRKHIGNLNLPPDSQIAAIADTDEGMRNAALEMAGENAEMISD